MSGAPGLPVADRLAIGDLIARYATAMDTQDWDLFRVCFRPDARTVMDRVGEFATREALIELLAPRFTSFAVLQHFITNVVVSGDADAATARSYFVSHHVPHGAAAYTYGGTFEFDLARDAEGWRIASHAIRILWEAGHPLPVAGEPPVTALATETEPGCPS
jgi:3-phenylpropionate/cinnamic acid dioxygenase small subunit